MKRSNSGPAAAPSSGDEPALPVDHVRLGDEHPERVADGNEDLFRDVLGQVTLFDRNQIEQPVQLGGPEVLPSEPAPREIDGTIDRVEQRLHRTLLDLFIAIALSITALIGRTNPRGAQKPLQYALTWGILAAPGLAIGEGGIGIAPAFVLLFAGGIIALFALASMVAVTLIVFAACLVARPRHTQ